LDDDHLSHHFRGSSAVPGGDSTPDPATGASAASGLGATHEDQLVEISEDLVDPYGSRSPVGGPL